MKRKRKGRREERNITRHQSALTVEENIQLKRRKIAGNLRKTKLPAQAIGNQKRAPEGVRGL
jgi:hypothetical protein